jgi:hypothetical protein
VKTVTYYKCEVCGNEYTTEALALACEASRPPCLFHVGQLVFYEGSPGSGFSRSGGGRAVEIDALWLHPNAYPEQARGGRATQKDVGHHWAARLRASSNDYGTMIETTLYWIDAKGGPYRSRKVR